MFVIKPSIFLIIFCSWFIGCAKAQAAVGACPPGQHWVKAHHRSAYTRADGVPVSASNITSHCQQNPPSYAVWKDRLSDLPSKHWLKRKEEPRKWTEDEREKIFEALSELPPVLLNETVRFIFRLKKSSDTDENPASGEAGEIAVYDPAFGPKISLARVLAHEFAHEKFRQFSVDEKNKYSRVANWLAVKNERSPGGYQLIPNRNPEEFVAEDGPESVTEDFANNIEFYLFNPTVLEQKTPAVFRWIKEKFGDKLRLGKGGPK